MSGPLTVVIGLGFACVALALMRIAIAIERATEDEEDDTYG